MIIGLTGKFAAGKGSVADLLVSRGYGYHSLSDILREELIARGLPESRDNLREVGNELRRTGGAGVLAQRLLRRLGDGALHIVDSIRNPAEVADLRSLEGFVLVSVDAAARVRYERLVARDRAGDPTTWERFQELEEMELASDDPTTQQLLATQALADIVLMNDGSLTELAAAVDAMVETASRGLGSS